MDTFQDPSPVFAEILGMWNKRDSGNPDISDRSDYLSSAGKPHKLALSGRQRKVMRSSTQSKRKDLIKPQVKKVSNLKLRSFKKRDSAEKWGAILSTTKKLVKAKHAFNKNRAATARLQNITKVR
jgi:hypothetical protein